MNVPEFLLGAVECTFLFPVLYSVLRERMVQDVLDCAAA